MIDVAELNRERATLRGRVNDLEQIFGRWRSLLALVGVDMDLGPENATDKLLAILNASTAVPALRDRLSAYESQMRHRIEAFSEAYYRAPEAIVVLHGKTVCGCDSMGEAAKIAAALNLLPEIDNR